MLRGHRSRYSPSHWPSLVRQLTTPAPVSAFRNTSLESDRKTVRKYIARGMDPPNYRAQPRRPRRIDDFLPYSGVKRLAAYPGLSAVRLLRVARAWLWRRLHAVKRAVQDIRPDRERRFEVRFETPPGEQAQVDFARFEVVFADEPSTRRIVWLFSMVLGFSRLIWAQFVVHQDLQSVPALPRRLHRDRRRTEGDPLRPHEDRGDRRGCRRLDHLQSQPDRSGASFRLPPQSLPTDRAKTKGKVERPFCHIRQDFYLAGSFRNLDDLNAQLRHWLDTVANPRTHATIKRVVSEAFAEEQTALRQLPLLPYRAVLKLERRVSHDGMISIGGNATACPTPRAAGCSTCIA